MDGKVEHWRHWSVTKRIREAARAIVPALLALNPGELLSHENLRAIAEEHAGPLDDDRLRRARGKASQAALGNGVVIAPTDKGLERVVGADAVKYQDSLQTQITGRLVNGARRYGIALAGDLTEDEIRKVERKQARLGVMLAAFDDDRRLENRLKKARAISEKT